MIQPWDGLEEDEQGHEARQTRDFLSCPTFNGRAPAAVASLMHLSERAFVWRRNVPTSPPSQRNLRQNSC
jgi:hypothetical protein